ncbi:SDR family NAD(P)-dependent oxidoreductase [Roseomonas sp. USHLN139]|uniref:SDR family NAD(P)-dependent oxidoreductase n=1 Tax=Roseomonas sp. USHLN139 TaxID=3081298 RepID=UPI003B0120D3
MPADQRLALVTGANRGLGLVVACGLARQGVHVLLGSRCLERGHAAAARHQDAGWMQPVQLDVTDDWSIAALAALIRREYGRLDLLVNNAGVHAARDPGLTLREAFEDSFSVNLLGVALVTAAMAPLLARSAAGRVVNVADRTASPDQHAAAPGAGCAMYLASKAALDALTLSQAQALAPQGIAVNAVCPGPVATAGAAWATRRSAAEGAAVVLRQALPDLPDPRQTFTAAGEKRPW